MMMISVKVPLIVKDKWCQAPFGEDCRFVERRAFFGLKQHPVCKLFNERLELDEPGPECYRSEKCRRFQITEDDE
jgi:hypothetical protein